MKRRFRFSLMAAFVCLTLSAIAAFAYRQLNPPEAYEILTQQRDDTLTWECRASSKPFAVSVSINDLSSTPRWNRVVPNPPVDAAAAMAVADKARSRFLKAQAMPDKGWVLSELKLLPFDEADGRWVWMVAFDSPAQFGPPSQLLFPVLMDSSVISPSPRAVQSALVAPDGSLPQSLPSRL